MNVRLSRRLKSIYRQERISTFLFTFGLADVALGGLSERWSLLSLGIFIVIMGGVVRWLQMEKAKKVASLSRARKYLPPSNINLQPLPPLKRKRDYI